MGRSEMAAQQKYQILANDLTRTLSNKLVWEISKSETDLEIEQFVKELKSSGYIRLQSKVGVKKIRKRMSQWTLLQAGRGH